MAIATSNSKNIFDYIKKYGGYSFDEKPFNEIDNLIFSVLCYVDLRDTKVDEGTHTIREIAHEYTMTRSFDEAKKFGFAMMDGYKALKLVMDTKRYGDIRISDYDYNANLDMQFGAMTFEVKPGLRFVSFEGTDQLLSGWKEDVDLACMFPVPAQTLAVQYLNRNVSIFGPKVIVGGHSKGGNLALVASMFLDPWKKHKLEHVYNNDGPGLRRKEFESARFKNLKPIYTHIVPENSLFGILLRQDNYKVIKASRPAPISHAVSNWVVIDDKLRRSTMSPKTKALEKSIIHWLDNHNDEQRRVIGEAVFGTMQKSGMLQTMDLKKPRNVIRAVSKFNKNVDEESKKIVLDFISSCVDDVRKA